MTKRNEGWGRPNGSRKFHWFTDDGRSLCRAYGFYSGPLEPDNGTPCTPTDCAKCRKLLDARAPEAPRA